MFRAPNNSTFSHACECHAHTHNLPDSPLSQHQEPSDKCTFKSFLDHKRKEYVGLVMSRCASDLGIAKGPNSYATTVSVLQQYLLDFDPCLLSSSTAQISARCYSLAPVSWMLMLVLPSRKLSKILLSRTGRGGQQGCHQADRGENSSREGF